MRTGPGRLLAAGLVAAAVGGCGGGSNGTPRPPVSTAGAVTSPTGTATPITPAMTKTVVAWAAAGTPQDICPLMTYSFKIAVGHGRPPAQCTSWITQAYGPFTVSSAHLISASKVSGQIAVQADLGGHPGTLYLVQECGSLKINSVRYFNRHQAPPSCPS